MKEEEPRGHLKGENWPGAAFILNHLYLLLSFSPSLKTPAAAVHDGFANRENDETVSNTLTLSNGLERRTNPRSEDDFEELQYFPNFYALLTSIDSGNHHFMTVRKGNETVILGNVWVVCFLFVVSKCSSLWHTLLAGKNILLFFFFKSGVLVC